MAPGDQEDVSDRPDSESAMNAQHLNLAHSHILAEQKE